MPRAQIQVCVSAKLSSWLGGGAVCEFWPFLLLPHFSSEMPIFIVRKGAVPEPPFTVDPEPPRFLKKRCPPGTRPAHMLDSCQRVHLTPFQKASSGTTKSKKNASFCRKEPFEGQFGPTEQAVRGPPCKSENETRMWSLNCPVVPEPPFKLVIFDTLVFLYKFSFKTFENQFELLAGRFVTPNCPSKFRHECKPRKKESRRKK